MITEVFLLCAECDSGVELRCSVGRAAEALFWKLRLYLLLRIKLSSQSGKICELFLLKIRPLSQPLLLPLVVEIPLVEFPITCFCECNGHKGRVWVFLQKKVDQSL